MKPNPTAHLPAPELLLEGNGRVSSARFGDIYFSRQDGAAETQHVFLKGNRLPERFAEQRDFTIGELGFGTGLNFLVAWKEFLQSAPPGHHLHYISVEKYPLTRAQLQQIGQQEILAFYPLRLPGWHRIQLERCTLTLGFGEAETLFSGIDAKIDAWFLDGFAPAKNPDMWAEPLLQHIGRLSAPGASFATFTAAGTVKRGLEAAGFAVEKVRGYGHKRDMLVGTKPAAAPRVIEKKDIAIIGAGIAGCTVARALAERGYKVTVLERDRVASGASGNPAAALYPQLTKFYTPATAWHATGYALMLRQLNHWGFDWQQTGMLVMPRDGGAASLSESLQLDPELARHVTQQEAATLAGMKVKADGIFLPQAGWLDPAALCRHLLQHENIMLREQCSELPQTGTRIFCTAHEAILPQLKLGKSAGQVTQLRASHTLCTAISHRGYVIPQPDGFLTGATYDHDDFSRGVTTANHEENLSHAREALPGFPQVEILGGRTSIRATTPDRLPYVGQMEEGVYVSVGHGSRGMISAPLAAEVIASQIAGETVPLTPELRAAIDPLRRAGSASR